MNFINRLLKSREYDELRHAFEEIKITIKNIEELKPEIWKRIYFCMRKLYQIHTKFPVGYINGIDVKQNMRSIACVKFPQEGGEIDTSHVCMSLNKSFYKNIENFRSKKCATLIDIDIDDFIEFSICHEFGHVIDIYYSIKFGSTVNLDNVNYFFEKIPFSSDIINTVFKDMYPDKKYLCVESILSEEMGETASRNYMEAFAEAVAFNYFGKNNIISESIIKKYKERVR